MATAADISPSDEKAFYMRVQALLVDGGTLVLRNLIASKYPGIQWSNHLNKQQVRAQLTRLRNKKAITNDQFDILYPLSGPTDQTKYDVSLMVCLLRNICGLNAQSVVWSGVPASMDHSEEADIRRLNIERNQMAHTTRAVLSEQDFENHWSYITEALLRLGTNIADLQQNLDNLKEKTIDPEKEQEMKTVIETWEQLDKAMIDDIEQLKTSVKEHDKGLEHLIHETNTLKTATDQLQTNIKDNEDKLESIQVSSMKTQNLINFNEQKIENLTDRQSNTEKDHAELNKKMNETNSELRSQILNTDKRVDEVKETVTQTSDEIKDLRKQQEKRNEMLAELKNMAFITKMFLEDSLSDDTYVETTVHRNAKERLLKNNVVILSGHPGEGKTTMAIKLMLEVSSEDKCLKLSEPSDWRHVDFELFDTIFIDDIFGPGVIDENLVKGWDKYLPEVWKAIQKKKIKVIVATRHYILDEARQMFQRSSVFKDDHVQFISSDKLSVDERTDILASHFRSSNIQSENADILIAECVAQSTSFLERFFDRKPAFLFGFPECANMFVRNAELFQRGSAFFMHPHEFFRKCVEDLRKDEEKFLALLVIWSKEEKLILMSDLDVSSVSKEEISQITESFGFKLKGKLLKTLRKSLKHHENGFLQYSSSNGSYQFSHNVINDMVGLVISEDFPETCLQFADRAFFQEFVTINHDQEGQYRFFVEEYLHERLMETCLRLFASPSRKLTLIDRLSLKRGGRRPNEIYTSITIDASVFFHEMFSDRAFAGKFIEYLGKKDMLDKILAHPMMQMSGFFLSYGFQLDKDNIYLPTYSLFHTDGVLFMEFLRHRRLSYLPDREIDDDVYLALLIAAHRNQTDVVKSLMENGTEVSEEAIYVAAISDHNEILRLLINSAGEKVVSKGKYENGNTALIVAAKKGLTESVRLLVKHSDLCSRNNNKVSAVEKAVIYGNVDVARILVGNGAPMNEKSKKFKRTPLHMACDMGQAEMVDVLLKAGAKLQLKDHRGHYPIHCAAIRGHTEIVKMLGTHDAKQVTWRIASYGKKSFICGMTVFHVAVWKNNTELTKSLLKISQDCNVRDWYGRTPIYCAAFEGKIDIFKLLLSFGDTRLPDKHGYTPLHAAINNRHNDIVDILLPMSDVNARDKYGKTPLHTACARGYCEIVRNLLVHGADPNIITKRGDSVFTILEQNEIKSWIEQTQNEMIRELLGRVRICHETESKNEPKTDQKECFKIIHAYSSRLIEMGRKFTNEKGKSFMNNSN